MQERLVDVATPDGPMDAFVTHPETDGPFPVVVVFMDVWGLREELFGIARRIATVGYYCLVPNFYHRAGKVRLLGVSTKSRVGILADVPAIGEGGLPGFESVTWYGLFAPKGLDPQITERVNASIRKAQETQGIKERLAGIGTSVRSESVEQFRATVKADRAKWAEIVKASGAKID